MQLYISDFVAGVAFVECLLLQDAIDITREEGVVDKWGAQVGHRKE